MVLHTIDNVDEVYEYQNVLSATLKKAGERRYGRFGYRGGPNELEEMYWFPDQRFCWGYLPPYVFNKPHHWNAFGITEPMEGNNGIDITCEINFPENNPTWNYPGAFAQDKYGQPSVSIRHAGQRDPLLDCKASH